MASKIMDHYRTPEMPEPADPNWRHPVEDMEPEPERATFDIADFCRAVNFILHEMKESRRPLQTLDCLMLATDLAVYYGDNGQTVADRYGISRQRVNVVVQEYQQKLGIIGGVNSKRSTASESYQLSNKRNRKCLP